MSTAIKTTKYFFFLYVCQRRRTPFSSVLLEWQHIIALNSDKKKGIHSKIPPIALDNSREDESERCEFEKYGRRWRQWLDKKSTIEMERKYKANKKKKHSKYLYVYQENLKNTSTWTKIHLEHRIVWNLWQSVYEKLHRFIVIFHILVSGFFFSLSILLFSVALTFLPPFLLFRNIFTLKDFHYQNFVLIPFCIF